MSRSTSLVLSLLCVAVLLASLHGADEPRAKTAEEICKTELSAKQLDSPPARETKYDAVAEPLRIKLQDVKLVEQKYAAVIRLVLPNHNNGTAETLRLDKELRALQLVRGVPFLGGGWDPDGPRKPWLPLVIKQTPADRRPGKEEIELFASPEFEKLWDFPGQLVTPPPEPDGRHQRHLNLLAPTPELAERRSRALLTLLDQGFTRTIQLAVWKRREETCKSLADIERRLPQEQAAAKALNEKLQQYQEFPPDLLPGLRVQLLQMEADLAGVKARIAAWDKLLAVKERRPERLQQIKEEKETADVELAGLEARRAKSAEFVDKVKERMSLVGQLQSARSVAYNSQISWDKAIQAIERMDAELQAFSPVQIAEDRVTIHPVEWTQ